MFTALFARWFSKTSRALTDDVLLNWRNFTATQCNEHSLSVFGEVTRFHLGFTPGRNRNKESLTNLGLLENDCNMFAWPQSLLKMRTPKY